MHFKRAIRCRAEIEIDWSTGRGEKQRHIGIILATGEKDQHNSLDGYAEYVSKEICKWVEEGKVPKDELKNLRAINQELTVESVKEKSKRKCKDTNTTRSMYVKNPVKKCVKNVSFSHTFHMFFTAFHMYFTHIFHMCVKFSIVKYM